MGRIRGKINHRDVPRCLRLIVPMWDGWHLDDYGDKVQRFNKRLIYTLEQLHNDPLTQIHADYRGQNER